MNKNNLAVSSPRLFIFIKTIIYSIALLLLVKCASSFSSVYESGSPLSSSVAKSGLTPLSVNIPQGWFVAEQDGSFAEDIWLIRDDYKASIKFVHLKIDSLTKESIKENELARMVGFSKTFSRLKLNKSSLQFVNEEEFEIDYRNFYAYEYADNFNNRVRVVVFMYGNNYYECIAVPLKEEASEVYKVQNSALASLR